MISKIAVKKLIHEVGIEYEKCWAILAEFKSDRTSKISGEEILEFQPILASALFRLDKLYCALSVEQSKVKARKALLSQNWFKARLKTISQYQEAIKETIEIGRALGDSFAWVFYRNDRPSLERHFQEPRNLHTPPGIGGQGELEFIRNVKGVNSQMILYHGITTFLRIGDVSLIDLKTLRVIALGDLKTKKTGTDTLGIGLFLTGPNLDKKIPVSPPSDTNPPPHEGLPPQMRKTLQKQFKKMQQSFETPKADRKIEYQDQTQIDALKKLAQVLERASGGYEKAGDGLLLIGIRNPRRKSLSSRFLLSSQSASNFRASLEDRFPDLVAQALLVIDKEQAHTPTNANSLFIGQLTPYVMLGTIPLFWRDIPVDFLRKIFFRDVTVITIYNPAHLIKRLRSLGYNVELINNGRHHKVTRTVGNSSMEVVGMDHFKYLITNYLMHEDVIVGLFSDIAQQVDAGEVATYTRINLSME